MPDNKTKLIEKALEVEDLSTKSFYPIKNIFLNVYIQINKLLSIETVLLFEKTGENRTIAYLIKEGIFQKLSLSKKESLIHNISKKDPPDILLNNKVLYLHDTKILKEVSCLKKYIQEGCHSFTVFPLNDEKRFLGIFAILAGSHLDLVKDKECQIREAAAPLTALAENFFLADSVKSLNKELNSNLFSIIELLISLIEIRDHYTSGHSRNVKIISRIIAKQAGLSPAEISDLSYASVLHDVGKINVPEKILNKPQKLTDDEFEDIKKHPLTGALLVANIPKLKKIAKIILHHHERYDGQGYPMNLTREQIPYFSRIIAVADSFDAIISQRSYRRPMTHKTAIEIIKKESGKQFDPEIVKYFLKAIEDPKYNLKLVKPFHKVII